MAYNTEVRITVRVDGKKVARRRLRRKVGNVESGLVLVSEAHAAVDALADELRVQAGV